LAADVDDEEGSPAEAPLAAVTHWVVADVASRQGLQLVAAALAHRSSSGRLALLVNSAAGGAVGAAPKEQRLLPIEKLLVAVGSGLLDTGEWVRWQGGRGDGVFAALPAKCRFAAGL
jgi:NAD(P)-dependent dehydrogenase (short-subunit alcohol dehydrogenase family)